MRRGRRIVPTTPEGRIQQRLSVVEGDPAGWRAGGSSDNGPLRIVRGRISSVPTASILSGSGFTITRNGVGDVTVTYSTAFPTGQVPSVTVTGEQTGGAHNIVATCTNGGVVVGSFRVILADLNAAFVAVDTVFNFQAIGLASSP